MLVRQQAQFYHGQERRLGWQCWIALYQTEGHFCDRKCHLAGLQPWESHQTILPKSATFFFFFLTSRGWEGIYSQGIRSQNPLNGSLVIAKCFLNSRQGDVGHSQVCNVNEENEASGMGFRSAFIIVCYPSYMDIHNSQCRERRGPI